MLSLIFNTVGSYIPMLSMCIDAETMASSPDRSVLLIVCGFVLWFASVVGLRHLATLHRAPTIFVSQRWNAYKSGLLENSKLLPTNVNRMAIEFRGQILEFTLVAPTWSRYH